MTEMITWAKEIMKRIHSEWEQNYSNANSLSYWKSGFATFFSPVTDHPKLMIISFQPGGNGEPGDGDFGRDLNNFRNKKYDLPPKNGYSKGDSKFAKRIVDLFGDEQELLEKA